MAAYNNPVVLERRGFCYTKAMNKRLPLIFILSLSLVVAILHVTGTYLNWYWLVSGFDRIVHTLGGFLVTFISLVIIYFFRMPAVPRWHIILVGIMASLVIGLGWEAFELKTGITAWGQIGFVRNNGGDILFDVVGGLLAIMYFIKRYR